MPTVVLAWHSATLQNTRENFFREIWTTGDVTCMRECCDAGDPVRFFHHLGLGVWSFLAYPAVGLVDSARGQGPWRFVIGLKEGVSSLLGNTIFALSNAAAKTSAAMRQVLSPSGHGQNASCCSLPCRQPSARRQCLTRSLTALGTRSMIDCVISQLLKAFSRK